MFYLYALNHHPTPASLQLFMLQLQRLNMDNSFFLEIGDLKLLIDPWLEGTEVDYFKWFNTQWHRTAPLSYSELPDFNTVLITQKYPDHFHEVTLKKISPKQVIAPKSLEKRLKKLLPAANIVVVDAKNNKVKERNIEITFLPTQRKIDPIYDAFILDDGDQSVFIATHGFAIGQNEQEVVKSSSPCKLLITPFNYYKLPFFLGGIVSPGIEGVKHLCEVLQPSSVVATHDEDKHALGLVTKFATVVRPKSNESLLKLPWLANRYQDINHYNRIELL